MKYDLKELWELTYEDRKAIYDYAIKRSDEIVRNALAAKEDNVRPDKENPMAARIWYELNNMKRYDIHWEWIEEIPDGEYLKREDVLKLVESYIGRNEK
jgi:hypothetical protein